MKSNIYTEKQISMIIKIQRVEASKSLHYFLTADTEEVAAQWSLCYWPENLKTQNQQAAKFQTPEQNAFYTELICKWFWKINQNQSHIYIAKISLGYF